MRGEKTLSPSKLLPVSSSCRHSVLEICAGNPDVANGYPSPDAKDPNYANWELQNSCAGCLAGLHNNDRKLRLHAWLAQLGNLWRCRFVLSPHNPGQTAQGPLYKISASGHMLPLRTPISNRKDANPLEQSHVLLPWQARARSHAATRPRSRVPGGSCCARGGLGRASS